MPSISKPKKATSLTTEPGQNQTFDVAISRRKRELHLHVGEQSSSSPSTFPGSGSYSEATTNETLQALIDRKLERSAVTGMRDLIIWFENKLA